MVTSMFFNYNTTTIIELNRLSRRYIFHCEVLGHIVCVLHVLNDINTCSTAVAIKAMFMKENSCFPVVNNPL